MRLRLRLLLALCLGMPAMASARPTIFQIRPEQQRGIRVYVHWAQIPNNTYGPLVVLSLVRADDAKEIPARVTLTIKDGQTVLWSGTLQPDPVETRWVIDGSTGKLVENKNLQLAPDSPKGYSFFLNPKLLASTEINVQCTADGKDSPTPMGMAYWFHLKDFLAPP